MTTPVRTLVAFAISWATPLVPVAAQAPSEDVSLAESVRTFRLQKLGEVDEATVELRELIAEKARALASLEEDLRAAEAELGRLEAIRAVFDAPAPLSPGVIPGSLNAVVPASAVGPVDPEWWGVLRISTSAPGRLEIVHESSDSSGEVAAGALRGDRVEIQVRSVEQARVIAETLRLDGQPVVTWPFRNVGSVRVEPEDRIDSLERTVERLVEAVDRIERQTSAPVPAPIPLPSAEKVHGALPPAPNLPD